jgi:hypothetical protein
MLRRWAERQRGAQRAALIAWVDHLAWMLEHPYAAEVAA